MKRRTKVGLVKLQAEDNVGPSFDSLPPELVVMVASNLDVSSYLALASSSSAILDILGSLRRWEALLQKTRMRNNIWVSGLGFLFVEKKDKKEWLSLAIGLSLEVPGKMETALNFEKKRMEKEVKELAVFLKFATDPKGVLFLALLHIICERLPADLEQSYIMVSVSCPCQAVHQVNSFGFALLEQAETIVGGANAKPKQNLVAYNGSGAERLEEFASRASRQKQKIEQIDIYFLKNSNKEGEVWLKLIQKCKSWKIEYLHLAEDTFGNNYNGLVEGLAKESPRGEIGTLLINDACIAKAKIAHLKRIWNITEAEWLVGVDSFGLRNLSLGREQQDWAET